MKNLSHNAHNSHLESLSFCAAIFDVHTNTQKMIYQFLKSHRSLCDPIIFIQIIFIGQSCGIVG